MKLDENQEAVNLLNNVKGSIENKIRTAYNLGYKDGYKNGTNNTISDMIADAVVRELRANQTIDSYSYTRGFTDGRESMRKLFEQNEPSNSEFPNNCANCKHLKKHNGNLADWVCDRKGSIVTNPYDKECDEMWERKDEPQTDGIIFKGNLKEGDYKLIKTTDGWVLDGGDIVYCGWERSSE